MANNDLHSELEAIRSNVYRQYLLEKVENEQKYQPVIDKIKFAGLGTAILGFLFSSGLVYRESHPLPHPQYEQTVVYKDINGDGIDDKIIQRRVVPKNSLHGTGEFEDWQIQYGQERWPGMIHSPIVYGKVEELK